MARLRKGGPVGIESNRSVLSEKNENAITAQRAETKCCSPNVLKTARKIKTGSGAKKTAKTTVKVSSTPEVRSEEVDEAVKKLVTKRTTKKTKNAVKIASAEQSESSDSKQPVYKKAGLTPLKRVPFTTSTEEKLHEYDFEFDEKEEEPISKKKRKPIMKIQRVRTYARKKKKEAAADNPAIPLLIQQMLLSTPLKVGNEKKRTIIKKNIQPLRVLGVDENRKPSSLLKEQKKTCEKKPENQQDSPETQELPPSPCPSFDDNSCSPSRPSSPIVGSGHENVDVSFHMVPLPTLHFGPITDSSTPNYATTSTPRYSSTSTRKSNVHRMSMNTPIKYHCEASDFSCYDSDEPRDYGLNNCFGFDEWDVDDPNQIKNYCLPPPPRPKPANLPKPPPMPAAEVIKLIEGSLVQVEEDSTMYDTSVETLLESASNELLSTCADGCSFVSEVASTAASESVVETREKETPTSHVKAKPNSRNVRKSYERNTRPRRLLKKKSFDDEEHEDESSEEEDSRGGEATDLKRKPPKKNKKREHGMTKKEEEDFEKWAAMFNAQCREIEKYELCVE